MISTENIYSQNLIIDCLNHLQSIKQKLVNQNNSKMIEEQLGLVIKDIKLYLQTIRINKDVFNDLQEEIFRLNRQKDSIINKHKQMLINFEMLIYQQDYQDLKARIDKCKCQSLEDSFLPNISIKKQQSQNSSELDKAFVLENSLTSENQFINCLRKELDSFKSHHKNGKIRQALEIINNKSSPFQKKQQVWLQMVYQKKSDDSSLLQHVKYQDLKSAQKMALGNKQISQFSAISHTQQYEPLMISRQFGKQNKIPNFSGKKIKSMILLKDKSSKKKSIPKTSVKKQAQNGKQFQNIEVDDQKLKNKLIFGSKLNDRTQKDSSKKKNNKMKEIKTIKSFRKTLIHNS